MNLEDIKQEEKEIFKSLNYMITHALLGTDLGLKEVKGDKLKEHLLILKGSLLSKIEHSIRKMSKYSEKIGIQPQGRFEEMPNIFKYNHEQIYTNSHESSPNNEVNIILKEKMCDYNKCAYDLIENKGLLELINGMIDNIKENKEYKIPLRVAKHLGIEL